MSAYMSTRRVKPPPPLFFFPFFLPRLSLVRPGRRLSLAPTAGCWRRVCQGWPLFRSDAGGSGAPAHHSPSVGPVEPHTVEDCLPTAVGAVPDGLKKRGPSSLGQPCTLDIFSKIAFERVVAGHLVELAALLMQPHSETALLAEDVGHVQTAGRGDAGEREDHHAN